MVCDGTISGIRMRKVSAARVLSLSRLTAKASATPMSVETTTDRRAVCSVLESALSVERLDKVASINPSGVPSSPGWKALANSRASGQSVVAAT